MNGLSWWLVEELSWFLQPEEREAVRGDFAESGESGGRALYDLLGLVLRRQATLWKEWRPWLALIGIVCPVGLLLLNFPQSLHGSYNLYSWIIQNYGDIDPAVLEETGLALGRGIPALVCYVFLMLSWSWAGGFALASLSRGAALLNGVLLCGIWGALYFGITPDPRISGVIFLLPFFLGMRRGLRWGTLQLKPAILLATATAFATALAIWAGRWGHGAPWRVRPLWLCLVLSWPVLYVLTTAISRRRVTRSVAALFVLMFAIGQYSEAAERPGVRAGLGSEKHAQNGAAVRGGGSRVPRPTGGADGALCASEAHAQNGAAVRGGGSRVPRPTGDADVALCASEKDRKPAPDFELKDAAGKWVKISDYRGKVVLLNFWATWCGGCKVEIPWFQQFHTTFGTRRFSVIGVSVDEEGWTVVKPYLEKTGVTYRMVVADKATPGVYAVTSLPATFLIDRKGRIAATYIGLVDRGDVEGNIKALLRK